MIKGNKISNFFNSAGKFINEYRMGVTVVLILCFFSWLSTQPRPEPSTKGYEESRVGRIDSIYTNADSVHVCNDTI